MQRARIKISGTNVEDVDRVCQEILGIAERVDVNKSGPIPLPTKDVKIPVRKSPDGGGTSTWDKWEIRIHKRLIDVDVDNRVMRQIMRIQAPEEVNIEIEMTA
ncbi:30S ribosomal protein S10 [candidate division MSBL1 archaeon SCGC-AAA261F19]|uniref:Small ribosomal subunit protein uS10 n=1 Tax=candidate division MSBL1 archaeon SCGC-AAA261F19 TaxID=1698275 RepID=A0A133V8F0_9EURY|nr:30S ribosomal protein S10 [candidate division MSBL1 archaeon SCGC-AAA261F19]